MCRIVLADFSIIQPFPVGGTVFDEPCFVVVEELLVDSAGLRVVHLQGVFYAQFVGAVFALGLGRLFGAVAQFFGKFFAVGERAGAVVVVIVIVRRRRERAGRNADALDGVLRRYRALRR